MSNMNQNTMLRHGTCHHATKHTETFPLLGYSQRGDDEVDWIMEIIHLCQNSLCQNNLTQNKLAQSCVNLNFENKK
jgi:hypothetical protein